MQVTRGTVETQREWLLEREDVVVPLVNEVRSELSVAFGVDVGDITTDSYRDAVQSVFDDGARAVNVATLVALLRDLDVVDDYPGFILDEFLGRELAAMIAGEQPLRLLAEATFHYTDVHAHGGGVAGADDLDAALAAGFQTRLPGWEWTETDPFGPK
ncbi:MAG: hypothetical protein ABEJ58_10715 [Halodesulfurarchaeum sp.]